MSTIAILLDVHGAYQDISRLQVFAQNVVFIAKVVMLVSVITAIPQTAKTFAVTRIANKRDVLAMMSNTVPPVLTGSTLKTTFAFVVTISTVNVLQLQAVMIARTKTMI